MTAYARHGRQRSACSCIAAGVDARPSASKPSRTPRSPRGTHRRPRVRASRRMRPSTARCPARRGARLASLGDRRLPTDRARRSRRAPRRVAGWFRERSSGPVHRVDSPASCSADGKRWCTSPTGRASAVPHASAIRPANVRAARTLICCPRIARTTSSNPSAVPGSRMPGVARTSGRSAGSDDSAASTVDGSASRSSNPRAVRTNGVGSSPSSPRIRSRMSSRSGRAVSSITAARSSGANARRNVVPSNDSTPGIVRSPRNRKSVSAASGGRYRRCRSINVPAPASVPHAP